VEPRPERVFLLLPVQAHILGSRTPL
jgi:hypothetical protein